MGKSSLTLSEPSWARRSAAIARDRSGRMRVGAVIIQAWSILDGPDNENKSEVTDNPLGAYPEIGAVITSESGGAK